MDTICLSYDDSPSEREFRARLEKRIEEYARDQQKMKETFPLKKGKSRNRRAKQRARQELNSY